MPRRVYSEINFHIIWHTKNNSPMITDDIEPKLYAFMKRKVLETPETIFHSVGGIADHIHIAVSVPPTIQPSDWVGKLKGASSYYVNHEITNRKVLEWQFGYGIISFGTKDLRWVIKYIENQKEHHAKGTFYERLERIDSEES